MVDAFCVKDDIINVPVVRVYEMFNDFCREENFDIKLTQNAFGRILRQHFNLDSKLIRLNGKMVHIYIDKEKEIGYDMTDFEKEYLLNLVEKELKEAKIHYEQALERNAPFEQVLNLAKKKMARERIKHIVRMALDSGLEDEL